MPFSLSNWILQRKIDAHVRNESGRPMEHRRVVNPYHSVSVETDPKCCKEVREIEGRRFLAAAAPKLPLLGCGAAACVCRYVHHNDRRSIRDRRVLPHNSSAHTMSDRRGGKGRRIND